MLGTKIQDKLGYAIFYDKDDQDKMTRIDANNVVKDHDDKL